MFKAKITFSNDEVIIISDGQLIFPISLYTDNEESFASKSKPVEIHYHIHAGLIPSITELLMKYDFFQLEENDGKVYKSSAVVTIENL